MGVGVAWCDVAWCVRLQAGRTPLHLAVAGGHEHLTTLLLVFGADLDAADAVSAARCAARVVQRCRVLAAHMPGCSAAPCWAGMQSSMHILLLG